jgi:hypothetical protein
MFFGSFIYEKKNRHFLAYDKNMAILISFGKSGENSSQKESLSIAHIIIIIIYHFNFFHSFLVFVCVVRFWSNFQVFGKQYLRNQNDAILGIIWETQN